MWVMEGLDGRRIERAVARLRNSEAALAWLTSIGVGTPFATAAGIGLEVADEDGLGILHVAQTREGRRYLARLRIDTVGAVRALAPGAPVPLWSRACGQGGHMIVLPDLASWWRLAQAVGEDALDPYVVTFPSHPGVPLEWRDAGFWQEFAAVTVMVDEPTGGDLLHAVAAAAGSRVTVALPPGAGTWRDVLANDAAFDRTRLDVIVQDAPPLAHYMGRADDAARLDSDPVDPHRLDRQRQLMRVLRIEERVDVASVQGRAERHRLRDVIVRSDGMMLDVVTLPAPAGTPPADQVVALSDGTRLRCAPSTASCCRWSFRSARGFLARGDDERVDGAALLADVRHEFEAVAGSSGDAAMMAAAFVMMSYVFQAFGELRVPVFYGGNPIGRARLCGTLARLAHNGLVRTRSRASVLAHAGDEIGGAIVLDEPGSLAGPEGPTEIGRFLAASCVAGSAWDYVGGSGRRSLMVFGPRAVVAQRRPVAALAGLTLDVEVGVPVDQSRAADEGACAALVDRLYRWSMRAIRDADSWTVGMGGAEAPILRLTAAGQMEAETAPVVSSGLEADALLREALDACTADGKDVVSITQLMLEASLRGGVAPDFSPERVGRWLTASGALAPGALSTRRRLHGHISRLYELRSDAGGPAREPADPFAFCTATRCEDCRYGSVCPTVFPGLSDRKSAHR